MRSGRLGRFVSLRRLFSLRRRRGGGTAPEREKKDVKLGAAVARLKPNAAAAAAAAANAANAGAASAAAFADAAASAADASAKSAIGGVIDDLIGKIELSNANACAVACAASAASHAAASSAAASRAAGNAKPIAELKTNGMSGVVGCYLKEKQQTDKDQYKDRYDAIIAYVKEHKCSNDINCDKWMKDYFIEGMDFDFDKTIIENFDDWRKNFDSRYGELYEQAKAAKKESIEKINIIIGKVNAAREIGEVPYEFREYCVKFGLGHENDPETGFAAFMQIADVSAGVVTSIGNSELKNFLGPDEESSGEERVGRARMARSHSCPLLLKQDPLPFKPDRDEQLSDSELENLLESDEESSGEDDSNTGCVVSRGRARSSSCHLFFTQYPPRIEPGGDALCDSDSGSAASYDSDSDSDALYDLSWEEIQSLGKPKS